MKKDKKFEIFQIEETIEFMLGLLKYYKSEEKLPYRGISYSSTISEMKISIPRLQKQLAALKKDFKI